MHPDMKSFFFSMILFALATFVAKADSDDPVLMRINGEPVYRSEFEYSYNKNGNLPGAVEQKSVEEYADMFVNYKLKVLAARAARPFRKNMRTIGICSCCQVWWIAPI